MTPAFEHYEAFVMSRAKPGQAVKTDLTAEQAHLLHMAVGVVGEVIELLEGVAKQNEENVKEELGDIVFYLVGFYSHFAAEPTPEPESFVGNNLLSLAGELLDTVKKHTIYQKPLDEAKVLKLLNLCWMCAVEMTIQLDTSLIELMQDNMDKLTKRYPTGYSDAAAQARADKQGEQQ